MVEMNKIIKLWFDNNGDITRTWSKELWENPEEAMEEYHACEYSAEVFRKFGFDVKTFNCRDNTAPANTVVASWGEGSPAIGIIGEYDALPGMGQEAVPYIAPKEGAGQGCGHSLMTPSCGSAAIALKAAMEAEGLKGSIRFIACPAEETVEGKMHLVRDGVFDGLDCCMAWHPQPTDLQVRENLQNSMTNMKVEFFGTTAHAAAAPEKGRSALDACELLNISLNYLREHVEPTTRMHYSYIAAGEKPNVVPRYAATHYFLRTKDMQSNVELFERFKKCIQGAALMTETDYKITVNAMVSGCVQINDFNQLFYDAMTKLPSLEYTDEEKAFAEELYRNVNGKDPEPDKGPIPVSILAPTHVHLNSPGSTDAGYVTHLVPTSRIVGLGMVFGTAMHSWAATASVGTELGYKAAIYAGMALAQCGYDILHQPERIKAWRADLNEQLKDETVKPIFPERIH